MLDEAHTDFGTQLTYTKPLQKLLPVNMKQGSYFFAEQPGCTDEGLFTYMCGGSIGPYIMHNKRTLAWSTLVTMSLIKGCGLVTKLFQKQSIRRVISVR